MYYSIFDYMSWYNWYYGITEEERVVVVERIETPPPPQVPLAQVSIAELETQQEAVVSKKKSTFKNYHLRK